MRLDLTAAVWQEGPWVVAECIELGISSQGRSEDEAMQNLEKAVLLYLQDEETGQIRAPRQRRKIRPLVVSA